MFAGIADTHTVIWYLFDDARLSAADRQAVTNILRATKSDLPPGFGLR